VPFSARMSATRGLDLGPVERGSFRPAGAGRGATGKVDMAFFQVGPLFAERD
jgi:hypothetical protein